MTPTEIRAHAEKLIAAGSSMMVLTRRLPAGKIGDKARMFGTLGGPIADVLSDQCGRLTLGCSPQSVIAWLDKRGY